VDVFSLVFGLLFAGVALIWGLAGDPGLAVDGWPLPVLLIVVGVAGLVSSIGGWRRRRGRADSEAADELAGRNDRTG
jgi:O-antigen/teichoic acid export membrane protein